ncbi:MAG: hypothetical protein SVS85_00605, partial [Candidatus Nanohaloarchaea archaeon]|nr:hypothetical protein [Candidatus Nanohaloarchaea archaeon]
MYDILPDGTLVDQVVRVESEIRRRNSGLYDGRSENGPGTFIVAVPGNPPEALADRYDEMDPLPWYEEQDAPVDQVYLNPDVPDPDLPSDTDVYDLFELIDRVTDGAILVGGNGRVHHHTVELQPDADLEDRYEPGWGTKTRAALDISATDLGGRRSDLPYIRTFDDALAGHVDAPVTGEVWQDRRDAFDGDVIAVATSSKTGEINLFDDGRRHQRYGPVEPSREMWERLRSVDPAESG